MKKGSGYETFYDTPAGSKLIWDFLMKASHLENLANESLSVSI